MDVSDFERILLFLKFFFKLGMPGAFWPSENSPESPGLLNPTKIQKKAK